MSMEWTLNTTLTSRPVLRLVQREAEAARTRGVTFEAQLRAVPLDDTADVRGIKRAADKVCFICHPHTLRHTASMR